ncbi:hypothetical protein GCM10009547_14070 [Sporichthya brevicatena]|uniref:Mannosyltransferase PIG-V n=1 Tax=Sporichthya brevicatena TaxID=171442 RepID=A0ABN1GKD0_9ACTN
MALEGLRDRTTAAPGVRELLLRCTLLCLAARTVLQVIGVVSVDRHGGDGVGNFFTLWSAWDAPHYLRLAEVGYRPEGSGGDDPLFIVFFPGYPAAVAVVHVVVRDLVLAGLTVSFAAAVAACYLLHRVTFDYAGRAAADRAVLLLLASPTAFFLFAPYTESLFLVGALGAAHALRSGRWPLAAAAGALATGTRVVGVAVPAAMAFRALRAGGPPGVRWRRLAWSATGGAGLLVYLSINQIVHGSPFHFLDVQREHWHQERVWPWVPISDAVEGLTTEGNGYLQFVLVSRLVAAAVVVLLLALGARALRADDLLYTVVAFGITMSAAWLISLPRYALVLWPLFVVLALRTSSRRVLAPVLAGSVLVQGWLFYRYAGGQFTY